MTNISNSTNKFREYYSWLFIVFAIFVMVCLLINCFFISPEADVFAYAFVSRNYDILEFQKYWYLHWSGRVIPNIVLTFSKYFIDHNWIYLLSACLFILVFYATVYAFVKKCFVFPNKIDLCFTATALSLTITQMFASLSSSFYWLPASITYTAPIILGFWSLYLFFSNKKKLQFFGILLLLLFTFFNEITDLLMIGLFIYLLLTQYNDKVLRKRLFLASMVVVAGSFTLLAAPGNFERKSFHHGALNFLEIFFYSNKALLKDSILWFGESPLLLFLILLFLASGTPVQINHKLKHYVFKNKTILYVFIWLILLVPYLIFYKLSGEYPPERVINIANCVFLLSAFFVFAEWRSKIVLPVDYVNNLVTRFACIVSILLIFYNFNTHSKNISNIITDATGGRGIAYSNQYKAQIAMLAKSKGDTAYIPKINTVASSISFMILDNDTTKINYSQYCLYFNKKKIIVQ